MPHYESSGDFVVEDNSVIIKTKQMGYNTDWNGQLRTNRPFTTQELKEWEGITDERHDSEFEFGDQRREFPSIWCGFEIKNYNDDSGTYGVFRCMGYEKTYQGKEWTIFFLKKLIKWSKTKDIYAEGELEWKGDDGDNDMGRLVVERAAEEIGYPPEEKMLIMHIETVDFKYRREKTAYVFKDAHKIYTDL